MSRAQFYGVLTILSSFMGYMEWGADSNSFVVTAEIDILYKLVTSPSEVMHPFVLIPLAGQVLLVISLFRKKPMRLGVLGILFISLLYLMLLFISIIGLNWGMMASVLPFFVFSILYLIQLRKIAIDRTVVK